MNVALCFSGLPRTLAECYKSLCETIIDPLMEKHNVHIFGAFQKDEECLKLLKFDCIEIKDIFVEEVMAEHFSGIDINCDSRIPNLVKQWKSWHNVTILRNKYEIDKNIKFDWVFRIRSDQMFKKELEDLCQLDNKYIYVPTHDNWTGCNDRFAFSSASNMDIYMNLIKYAKNYLNKNRPVFHPERTLKAHFDTMKMEIKRTQIWALNHRGPDHNMPGTRRPRWR